MISKISKKSYQYIKKFIKKTYPMHVGIAVGQVLCLIFIPAHTIALSLIIQLFLSIVTFMLYTMSIFTK